MDPIFLVVLAIFTLSIGYLVFFRKRFNLPPGPKGLPYIGNAWQIDHAYTYLDLTELGKKYGDIFRIKLYGHDIIVLSGEEMLQRALVTDSLSFAGRPRHVRVEVMRENGFHVSFCDYGPKLQDLKKSLINCMRMYGDGLQRLEDLMTEMTTELLEVCQETKGQPHDFEQEFFAFVMKIMVSLACAKRMSKEDIDAFVESEKLILPHLGSGCTAMILDQIPWLQHFPLSFVKDMKRYINDIKALIDPCIEERKQSFDGKNMECLVDAMLKSNIGLREEKQYNMADIRSMIQEICSAGILTSTSSVSYFLAQCIIKPEMQKRIQMDIDRIMGMRTPTLADRKDMPYLEAALLETFRIMSNAPLMLPHKTTTDVEIGGYKIPKDTQVWINSWSFHHDERYWDEPMSFKPERFLSEDGTVVLPDHINRRRLMAFGAGRRVCMGEAMAKARLFLLISTILQRYTLLPENDNKLPDTDPRHLVPTLVLFPPPYKMRMIPRV